MAAWRRFVNVHCVNVLLLASIVNNRGLAVAHGRDTGLLETLLISLPSHSGISAEVTFAYLLLFMS